MVKASDVKNKKGLHGLDGQTSKKTVAKKVRKKAKVESAIAHILA
jgi:hypothetical protein